MKPFAGMQLGTHNKEDWWSENMFALLFPLFSKLLASNQHPNQKLPVPQWFEPVRTMGFQEMSGSLTKEEKNKSGHMSYVKLNLAF